jgi:hypothetical protein
MWARARIAIAHELRSGPFVRYLGFFLPSVARLPDRGYCPDGTHRMVIATSTHSTRMAHVDLSLPDSIVYICALGGVLWLVKGVTHGG